ncbi:unnamed protein product [Protopolystoma xenopodis]|uniref:6-phosphogluconolactonase n=1 Tax=Protopolystoma xenopodis TaxID=117903 RepID=A0A3S5BQX6_9PLAT|nr:unnamed protein product [Protopolystoma xenopodis]
MHESINWTCVHFFYCDERLVHFESNESTHGQYQRHLYSKICIPPENIHAIKPSLPVKEAASHYQSELLNFFGSDRGIPSFDILILGIGPDGHTCSLFPNHPLLGVDELIVASLTDSPKPPPERVTLTLPIINRAKRVAFVATGEAKSEAVHHIHSESASINYPASLVRPFDGELLWFLDGAASSKLHL